MDLRAHKTRTIVLAATLVLLASLSIWLSFRFSSAVPHFAIVFLLYLPLLFFFLLRLNPLVPFFFFVATRFILDSFPQYTHQGFLGTLSPMKLHSLTFIIFSLGYLYVKRAIRLDWLGTLFLAVTIPHFITSAYHHTWQYFIVNLNKWICIWMIILFTRECLKQNDVSRLFKIYIWCCLYPIVNLLHSVITGQQVYAAGAFRYIGTYGHQREISFILLSAVPAALYLLMKETSLPKRIFYFIVLTATHAGILLSSYRTIWIALCTYWLVFIINALRNISLSRKAALLTAAGITFVLIMAVAGGRIQERLSPLFTLLKDPSDYIDLSDDSSVIIAGKMKRSYSLSGRVDLWNASVRAYIEAPFEEKILGLGVGEAGNIFISYLGAYASHAHNEYLSSLLETGVLGLSALLAWIFVLAHRIFLRLRERAWETIVSAPMFFCFMVAAMGTMPFRDLRAAIGLGMYTGVALFAHEREHGNEAVQIDAQ